MPLPLLKALPGPILGHEVREHPKAGRGDDSVADVFFFAQKVSEKKTAFNDG